MPWYAFLLAPFALIFWVITSLRNFLYDQKILKSHRSPIPTLIVGNLSVGGTGKTPMVEFLIRNFRREFEIVSLSRGYGRKTRGFIQAHQASSAEEIGDEPLQIYQNFEGEVPVFVGEDRVEALQKISKITPKAELAILDDAFQHRRLSGDFYCVLTPFSKPFTADFLLPMGRLRESAQGAKRADLVVVTKCPESLSTPQKAAIRDQIRPFLHPEVPVVFSRIGYGKPYPVGNSEEFSDAVVLVSGLADDQPLISYCRDQFHLLEVLSFSDHHSYAKADLERVVELMKKHHAQNPVLLTTEKDAVKLKSQANRDILGEIPIFVLPIEAQFESEDKQMLLNYIREKFRKK
jgi:tetraacyldisaccharide 4'-kinase